MMLLPAIKGERSVIASNGVMRLIG